MSRRFRRPEEKTKGSKVAAPASAGAPSPDTQTPTFCLHYLGGNYCLTKCDTKEKADLAERLHKLSSMTWQEIKHAQRHGLGFEIISRKSLKTDLPPAVKAMEDVTVLAFRFSGKKPMVGYRDGRTFHIVFLDRDFTLYPHGS